LFTQTSKTNQTNQHKTNPTTPPTTHQPNKKKQETYTIHGFFFFPPAKRNFLTSFAKTAGGSSTLDGSSVQLWEKGMELMRLQAEGCHGTQLGVMFHQFFWVGEEMEATTRVF